MLFVLILILVIGIVVPVVAVWISERMRDHLSGLSHNQQLMARRSAQLTLAGIVLAAGAAALAFALIRDTRLQQTSLLFIGVPVLLALSAVFIPTGASAVGVACKTVTLGLLLSLIFLGEGMVCILMSAPLFYLVAIAIGKIADEQNGDSPSHRSRIFMMFMALAPMSVEGVAPLTTIDRDVVVAETRLVAATPEQVATAIVAPPRFDRVLPAFLASGFPRPTDTHDDGQRWVIQVRGGEMRLNGMEPRAGTLILEREAEGPGFISWKATADDSHMRHFLSWQSSRVEWTAIDAHTTRVTWTLTYHRDLDPAWYFGPMERYAVRLAAGYLIDAVATP